MKKIISLLVTLLIICSLFVFSASAANSAIISLSAENVVIGDKVNVTVKLKFKNNFNAFQMSKNV